MQTSRGCGATRRIRLLAMAELVLGVALLVTTAIAGKLAWDYSARFVDALNSSMGAAETQIEIAIKELEATRAISSTIQQSLNSYGAAVGTLSVMANDLTPLVGAWSGVAEDLSETTGGIADVCRNAAGLLPVRIPAGLDWQTRTLKLPNPIGRDLDSIRTVLKSSSASLSNVSSFMGAETTNSVSATMQLFGTVTDELQRLTEHTLPSFIREMEVHKRNAAASHVPLDQVQTILALSILGSALFGLLFILNALALAALAGMPAGNKEIPS